MGIRNTGSGDYLIRTAGGFYNPAAMTAAFWLNLLIDKDALGAAFGLRNSGDNNGYVVFYNPSGDGITYGWEHFDGSSTPQLNMSALSLGVWTFIALSRSGTGANHTTAYRRAAGDAALTSQTGTFPTGQTINEEVVLSNNFNLSGGWFPGRIAALKQWSAALTADELLAESYQYAPVRFADLHSWRPMIHGVVADAALDFSGNGRALTPNGALTIEDGPPIQWRRQRRIFVPITAGGGALVAMDGVIAGRSSAQGVLSVTRGLSGQAAGQARTTGAISVVRNLAGVVAGGSTAQGAFNALRRLAGIAQGVGRAIGSLFLASELLNPLAIDDRTIDGATWEDGRTIDDATWEDFKAIDLPLITMTAKDRLNPIAKGDARTVRRTYRKLPTGALLSKAWLTIKKRETDLDAQALIQKDITTSPTVKGQITDADTAGGEITMFFEITKEDTAQSQIKVGVEYPFDIQILRATGQPHTLSKGTVQFFLGVTDANS